MKKLLTIVAVTALLTGCASTSGGYYTSVSASSGPFLYGHEPVYGYYDYRYGRNPNLYLGYTQRWKTARPHRDTDRDGVPNRLDRDIDGDGIANRVDRDRDGDGISNRAERTRHPRRDSDRDGIPNRVDRDRDGDGIPNRVDRNPNQRHHR